VQRVTWHWCSAVAQQGSPRGCTCCRAPLTRELPWGQANKPTNKPTALLLWDIQPGDAQGQAPCIPGSAERMYAFGFIAFPSQGFLRTHTSLCSSSEKFKYRFPS